MKLIMLLLSFALTGSSNAQQFLWTTAADSAIRQVSRDSVEIETLKFYDVYKVYYDGSGFTKETFTEMFQGPESKKIESRVGWRRFTARIKDVTSTTYWAIKDNFGRGSMVLVLCVDSDNIDMVAFSNEFHEGANVILESRKSNFENWLKTVFK